MRGSAAAMWSDHHSALSIRHAALLGDSPASQPVRQQRGQALARDRRAPGRRRADRSRRCASRPAPWPCAAPGRSARCSRRRRRCRRSCERGTSAASAAVTRRSFDRVFDELRIGVLAEQVPHRPGMGDRRVERDHRVAEDQEVGPAAGAVDGIGGVGLAGVEMRAGGRGEVSAGREAHHADPVGRDAELLRRARARAGWPAARRRARSGGGTADRAGT